MKNDMILTRRATLGLFGAGATVAVLSESVWAATEPNFPKGAIIRTLLKDLPPSALAGGATLFHEHLSLGRVSSGGPPPATPRPPTPTSDVNYVIGEVKTAGQEGVVCIVDGGHSDMGRNLDNLKQIANNTPVHIVASGGYYDERAYPPDVISRSEDQIAEELAHEAQANRYGAFGEIGENPNAPMSEAERKMFRAIGKAHLLTNLPIFTHNAYATGPNVPMDAGLRQLDVLESVGVKPQHIVIGHVCCIDDPNAEIAKQIAKRGAFVGFDRAENPQQPFGLPDAKKVVMVQAFLEAGYANKLLISGDYTGARTAARPGYGAPLTVFVPLLRKAGIKEETIHMLINENPRRFLAFVPKKVT